MLSLKDIKPEARSMLALAGPVVVAQLSLMSMGFVDTLMVAPLGKEQLGAVSIGAAIYFVYMVFAFGVINSVGPMVAQAFGARDDEEIGRTVGQGIWLAGIMGSLGMILYWNVGP